MALSPYTPMNSRCIFYSLFSLFLFALTLSAVSTKIAGLAWLTLVILGLVNWCSNESGRNFKAQELAPKERAIRLAVNIWLLATCVALILKAIPMLYWESPWNERHPELRLLLGAIGLFGLIQNRIPQNLISKIGISGGCACISAFTLLILQGPDGAPTHRIAWASGFALCILATLSFSFYFKDWRMYILLGTTLIGAFGVVLLSGVRGAMILGPIWLLNWFLSLIILNKFTGRSPRFNLNILRAAIIFIAIILILLYEMQIYSIAESRINLAFIEVSAFFTNEPNTQNTSVGARLHLWRESINIIENNIIWGTGLEQRIALIHSWGDKLESPVIRGLGHLHNEYLQSLMEHGLWGLMSFLSYTMGILFVATTLWRGDLKIAAISLFSIAVMHSVASITNMNFAHNYYPTLLSLSISITILGAILQTNKDRELSKLN